MSEAELKAKFRAASIVADALAKTWRDLETSKPLKGVIGAPHADRRALLDECESYACDLVIQIRALQQAVKP